MRWSKATGVPINASSDIAPATWAVRHSARACTRAMRAMPVCVWVPLISVIPSLGARVTLGNDIGAQQHHRAHFSLRKPVADTRRVAAHEVHLQLRQPLVWNGNFGKLPEAGRHSVDD